MDIVLFHNPRDAVSCKVLKLIEDEGHEPAVIEYLRTPPTADELRLVLRRLKSGPRAIMRKKDATYLRLGLGDPTLSEGRLIDAMVRHPELIDGPIVVTEDDAVVARPADKLYNVL